MPTPRFDPRAFVEGLRDDVGESNVSTTRPDREAYSRDLWPRSLLDSLSGPAPGPMAVVWPTDEVRVSAVVRRCASAGVPIVPFGAGSGVCGGALADPSGVVVDLKRLDRVLKVDLEARTVDVQAGINGELFERRLERQGLTLGHFPSSIVCSTVGGWLATRSAGQCSARYGKIEDMVLDLSVVTGDGVLRRTERAGSPGLDWNQLFVGSEGTLGLITRATLALHPQPETRCFRGYLCRSVEDGLDLIRRVLQDGHRPAVLRLYDPLDTMMAGQKAAPGGETSAHAGPLKALLQGVSSPEGMGARALRAALSVPQLTNALIASLPRKSLLVTVTEGSAREATLTDEAIARVAKDLQAQDLGEGPGRHWLAHRHDVSYKQSRLYRAGAFVDTFEVATTWARLPRLYEAVRGALGLHTVVMAHFSHAYAAGCSIYFTFVGTGRDVPELRARYLAAWQAALDAALLCEATLAHHHGVGLSRATHLQKAHGPAVAYFQALKRVLDPQGILNPGKIYGAAV